MLTYEITVSNTGERIATGVNITTELSNGLSVINNGYWTGISLDSGDTKILQLQARVTSLPLTGMDITFTGNAIFNGKEDNKSNNSVSLTHHLDGLSDVYVQHTMSPFSGFRQGDSVFYTIVYGNS
ncbi:TPA: hypothetical protein DEP21_02865 [Patescibacteria group bacterium]|nr:hypothetical protein [Candidatus Gracilibacteria bacterium]